MIKILPYILYLFIIAFYRTLLIDPLSIFGAVIDLSAMMVALIGLYKNENVALWFAIGVSILIGSQQLHVMPWEMLVLGGGALIVNQCGFRMNLESVMSRIMVLGAFIFVHQIAVSLLVSPDIILYALYKKILPSVIYTVIIGWVFFQIKDGKITFQKIKSLF